MSATDKIKRGLRQAIDYARGNTKGVRVTEYTVTDSCGCVFCDLNLEPVRDQFNGDYHMHGEQRIPCERRGT